MLIPVNINQHGIHDSESELKKLTFKELGIKENDIENFLKHNLDLLVGDEESLLIVGQQVRNKQNGRSDLVAVDEKGNLVLIEIKRDVEDIRNRKEPFEIQAIRYAANYAKIQSKDQLVNDVFVPYLEKQKGTSDSVLTTSERARRILTNFLVQNEAGQAFNRKQRMILVASEFDEQTLSACAWLISNGVDISCFTIEPVKLNEQYLLDITKVLPVPHLEDFYVEVQENHKVRKSTNSMSTNTPKQFLPRMNKLFDWGLLRAGDEIIIKNFEDSSAIALNEKEVEYQGKTMSYNQWGQTVTSWSSINIYEWTIPVGQTKTLHDLRLEKMRTEEEEI
ncbi:hypothetical protein [Alkalihalobacterium alkalinitrilicum]|uniref:hypothetical protein n=1 Tax=Alkalihalobacterium alkalinitrilicum TaxID=427920 RepID=UPI000994E1AB|nr:hypothetical protein [Alkalihalobacterium alkalinitrilicum]